jgi:hypothetical protein
MKRTYLFFVLVTIILTVAIMAEQPGDNAKKFEAPGPFKDFVSRCREDNLTERMREYRAKIDVLLKQGWPVFAEMRSDVSSAYGLIFEVARQGDFESLEMLEKDLLPDLKKAVWMSVVANNNTDDAKRLLVKWAKENPSELRLMPYHPNGVNLLIELAEDKNAPVNDRVMCLDRLAFMPAATKVLDRIKALRSDQSEYSWSGVGGLMETIGSVAAQTLMKLEAINLQ